MSAATSPGTGLAYGLRRVCAAWGMARSSFYAVTSGQHAEQPPAKRRGAAGRRPRLRRAVLYNAQWIDRKERLPEPRSSSSGRAPLARRDLNQARRVRQTCVQGTGCATSAAFLFLRDGTRISSTSPSLSTARHRYIRFPLMEENTSSRCHRSSGRGRDCLSFRA